MLEILIIVLVLLWLFGYFGGGRIAAIPKTGLVHLLLVIVIVLVIVRLVF